MKSLDEYLDSYLEGSSDPGTAVMLIGHWGSGKTHYIQGYFRRREDLIAASNAISSSTGRKWWRRFFGHSSSKNDSPKTLPVHHIYASFFGAENAAAISDQFLSQIYPVLNSGLGKVLGAAAIRVSNLGVQLATAGVVADAARDEDAQAIKRWLSNPDGRVLVFDDLERANMPMKMCLSIINGYVERDGLKVIVLANESEIDLDSAYGRWKEKVIGKTVHVVADPEVVLDSLLFELEDGPVGTAVKNDRAALLSVMGAAPFINYRSVRSLIFDAQRLLKILDRRLRDSQDGVLELLKFSIALGGELRAKRIEAGEVEMVQQCFGIRAKEESKRTERDQYILDLERRFESVLALDSVIPASELVSFWRAGSLDVEAANAALLKHPLVVGVHAQPAWQRLWDLRRLSIGRYKEARDDLLASIAQRELHVQGEILHVAGIALTLEDFGVAIFPQFKKISLWVQQYASDPIVFNRLERSVGFLDGVDAYSGLGFHKRKDSRFIEAFKALEDLVVQAEHKRLLEGIPSLLLQIRERDYSNIYSFGAPGSVGARPWIHLVEPDDMVDVLLSDGVMQSPLVPLLVKRYSEDLSASLRFEWRSLRLLRERLRLRIRGLPEPFRSIATEAVDDASGSIREAIGRAIDYSRALERRRSKRK